MRTFSREKILLIKEGNSTAFREFYELYSPQIYDLSLRLLKDGPEAEEVVQECFMNMWQNRMQLDENKDLWALLYVSAKRLCFNQLRRSKSVNKYLEQIAFESVNDVEEKIRLVELEKILDKRMTKLTPQQRKVLELSRLNGYTHKEIAEEMAISTQTVKNHITQALKQLRPYLFSSKILILIILLFF